MVTCSYWYLVFSFYFLFAIWCFPALFSLFFSSIQIYSLPADYYCMHTCNGRRRRRGRRRGRGRKPHTGHHSISEHPSNPCTAKQTDRQTCRQASLLTPNPPNSIKIKIKIKINNNLLNRSQGLPLMKEPSPQKGQATPLPCPPDAVAA